MHALDLLNDKLDLLLKKHAAIQVENNRLKAAVVSKNRTIEHLKKKLSSLEGGMVSVRLGSAAATDDEKDNMREQINMVISDIDKILITLND
jgi:hypothetical protein